MQFFIDKIAERRIIFVGTPKVLIYNLFKIAFSEKKRNLDNPLQNRYDKDTKIRGGKSHLWKRKAPA